MYAGKLTEVSTVHEMFTDPLHPYAQALIESLPSLENKGVFKGIPGLAPALLRLPPGCAFNPRCQKVMDICRTNIPQLEQMPSGRFVSCHLYDKNEKL